MVPAMAVFMLNAMTSVGGRTPYQAVYGRQLGLLPLIEGAPQFNSSDGRAEQRIRDIYSR